MKNYSSRKKELEQALGNLEKQREELAKAKNLIREKFESALPTMEDIKKFADAFGFTLTQKGSNDSHYLIREERKLCYNYSEMSFRKDVAELMEASGYDPRTPDISYPMVSVPLGITGFKAEIGYQVTEYESGPFGTMIAERVVVRDISIVKFDAETKEVESDETE